MRHRNFFFSLFVRWAVFKFFLSFNAFGHLLFLIKIYIRNLSSRASQFLVCQPWGNRIILPKNIEWKEKQEADILLSNLSCFKHRLKGRNSCSITQKSFSWTEGNGSQKTLLIKFTFSIKAVYIYNNFILNLFPVYFWKHNHISQHRHTNIHTLNTEQKREI